MKAVLLDAIAVVSMLGHLEYRYSRVEIVYAVGSVKSVQDNLGLPRTVKLFILLVVLVSHNRFDHL